MSDQKEELDWLTEMDEEILSVLGTDLTLTPSIIAENIDRSQKGVGNRLSALQAGGLVDKVERGKYKLTEEGKSMVFKPVESSEAQNIEAAKADHEVREQIQDQFGVSKEEYLSAIQDELEKVSDEASDRSEAFDIAIERVEERLKKY
jgi:DNA-binding Lrp family transcriptional regulator